MVARSWRIRKRVEYKGAMKELLGGGEIVLYLDCDGGYTLFTFVKTC